MPLQSKREIEVSTPLGEDVLLFRRMTVKESLGGLTECRLDLLSKDEQIVMEDVLGKNMTIRLSLPNGRKRYFNGYVSRFCQSGRVGNYALYKATLYPWLWFLTRTADCRIFQEKTVPDIIKEIFREHGLTDFQEFLGTYRKWVYCVQYRETDFNFISRLMEQEGIYYFIKHDDGEHKLILADSYSAHKLIPGYENISYVPPDETFGHYLEHIHEWQLEKQIQSGVYALNVYDFERPKVNLTVKTAVQRQHANADYEIYDYPGEYVQTNDGETYVRARIESLHAQYEQVNGKGNARGLAVGGLFKLNDYPRADQNREYLVVSAVHELNSDEYETKPSASSEPIYSCSFTAIESKQPYRMPRATPKPFVQGPQTAVVVGKAGEEIWTDKYGRVKVQFHWDRYGKMDENSSCWVRVSHSWAGKGWGAISIPRIGQEVIVDFLEGDPDQPIITGRVYNADQMPSYQLPNYATMSTLKSNSSKGGGGFNEIRFEDKKGEEQIFIHGEKNQDVRIKNDIYEWVGSNRHLIVKKDQFEQVGGDKHLTVTGDRNEKVGGTISVTTGMDMQEKIGMNHAIDAGMAIHLKAGMNVVIEAGMSITLKAGAGFIVVGPAGVTMVGTPTLINSGGAAGSGAGCSADTPALPKEAANAKPGEVDKSPPPGTPPTSSSATSSTKTAAYSPSAQVLKQAAQDGTPFCEKCEAARRAREQQGS